MSLLNVSDLQTHFKLPKGVLRAVDGVSFTVERGETVGLVGESGCGKSTLGRSLLRLETPTAGHITLDGQDILPLKGAQLRGLRKRMQMIFQDPMTAFNPVTGSTLRCSDSRRVLCMRANIVRLPNHFL